MLTLTRRGADGAAPRNNPTGRRARSEGRTTATAAPTGAAVARVRASHDARPEAESLALAGRPWRQGRRVPRNVYAQVSDDPADDDVIIGQFDSALLARDAVDAHNWRLVKQITGRD